MNRFKVNCNLDDELDKKLYLLFIILNLVLRMDL